MAEAGAVDWPVEEIPDEDSLFLRVHHTHIVGDDVQPAAFTPHDGLSTDWSKYATVEWTRANAGPHPQKGTPRPAENYGVVALGVRKVRALEKVGVQHSPKPDNRAHTDIQFAEGDKERVRVELGRISDWAIKRA
jgi:hypothetical protein